MEEKNKADYLVAVFSLAVLSQMGHELNMDKVTAIAKESASVAVDEILRYLDTPFWKEVKQHIEDGKDK
jgi:monoamine oxidase